MSLDVILVSATQPTDADVQRACADLQIRGRPVLAEGSFSPDPELAEEGLDVGIISLASLLTGGTAPGIAGGAESEGELAEEFAALYTPAHRRGQRLAAVSTSLGLAAPVDADGRAWITQGAIPRSATDEEILATLTVLRALAQQHRGYVLGNGEYVELDGVPAPPAAAPEKEEQTGPRKPPPPRLSVFCAARLDLGPVPGDEGWHKVMRHVAGFFNLTGDADLRRRVGPTALLPEDEDEWIRLDIEHRPRFWPTASQELGRSGPRARWEVDGASGPGDTFSGFSFGADIPATDGTRVLTCLESLVPHHLQYGFVHLWTPAEPPNAIFWRPTAERYDPKVYLFDHDLGRFMPNLYWAQVFGPPWVELFGADRIASLPVYRVEELAPSVWAVQLTENLADVGSDYQAFDTLRERCKQHLGADCFYDAAKTRHGTYRGPHLPDLAERGLVPPPPSIEEFLGTRTDDPE